MQILYLHGGRKKGKERVRLKTEAGNTAWWESKLENCLLLYTVFYSFRASPEMAG